MKVIFFGTPDFAVPILKDIVTKHEVSLVVTAPDRPKGRGKKLRPSPVKEFALEKNIPIFQPENINDKPSLERLAKENGDVFVVAAYGFILKPSVLELPKYHCINVHGSILPKYRGAAPIERAIINGDEEIGISIMKMEEGMDTGPVAKIVTTKVEEKSASTLRRELSFLGGEGILEVLSGLEQGDVNFIPQEESLATYAPKITKSEGQIRPKKETTFQVLRKIQGMDTYGGAYILLDGVKYKVFKGKSSLKNIKPGHIIEEDKRLFLGCKDGSIELMIIQVPNKGRMDTKSYLLGNTFPTELEVEESYVLSNGL
ncbi:MAG: methionyl-tRNA formyltransferase [Tissierellia bacterium]|nr:methionyl-tRNA formyltransferase [Tissierellia bacterium]